MIEGTRLTLDIKAQDLLRRWFSERGGSGNVLLSCVELGDSDIDYETALKATEIQVLNSPYDLEKIKHKLIYEGAADNLIGHLTLFLRNINSSSQVSSLYSYPASTNYTLGVIPPTLANGNDWNTIPFDILSISDEGFIGFLQTLPDNYLDSNGVQQRFIEEYDYTVTGLPLTWELIIDTVNNSFLIAKPASYSFIASTGTIRMVGKLSNIEKTITFPI